MVLASRAGACDASARCAGWGFGWVLTSVGLEFGLLELSLMTKVSERRDRSLVSKYRRAMLRVEGETSPFPFVSGAQWDN